MNIGKAVYKAWEIQCSALGLCKTFTLFSLLQVKDGAVIITDASEQQHSGFKLDGQLGPLCVKLACSPCPCVGFNV